MHADANVHHPGTGPTGAHVTEKELQDARQIAQYFRNLVKHQSSFVVPNDPLVARWERTAELLERAY